MQVGSKPNKIFTFTVIMQEILEKVLTEKERRNVREVELSAAAQENFMDWVGE